MYVPWRLLFFISFFGLQTKRGDNDDDYIDLGNSERTKADIIIELNTDCTYDYYDYTTANVNGNNFWGRRLN